MQTMDHVFSKEFKDMMNGRKSIGVVLKSNNIALPSLDTLKPESKKHFALVKGVKEYFFERLNKEEVKLIKKTTLKKRQVLSDGTFRKDKNGNYVYTDISVPKGSVAILSSRSIGLKRYIEEGGVKREHKVTIGYRYVDYVDTQQGRRYIYIIPKEFVYRLNMCALIMTPNKHRVYYKGCKLALQNGTYVYLYVIPYKHRENSGYRVLGIKSDFNFDIEVKEIIKYWSKIGVLFDLNLTSLDNQVRGITNLGIIDLEGTCQAEDYKRYELSLSDEKESDFNEL